MSGVDSASGGKNRNDGGRKKNNVLLFEGGIHMMWNGSERSFGDSSRVQVDKKYLYFGEKGNWTIKLQELNVLPLENFLENYPDNNDDSILFSDMKESKQFICHYQIPPQSHRRSRRYRHVSNRPQSNQDDKKEMVMRFLETVLQRCHRRGTGNAATTAVVTPRDFTTTLTTTKSRYHKSYGKRRVERMLEKEFYSSDRDEVDDPPSSPLSPLPRKKLLKTEPSPDSNEELFPTAATPITRTASQCSIAVTDEEDHQLGAETPIVAKPSKPISSFFTSGVAKSKSTRTPSGLDQYLKPTATPMSTDFPTTTKDDDIPPFSPKTKTTNSSPSPKVTIPDTRCTPDKKLSPFFKSSILTKESPVAKSSPVVKLSPQIYKSPLVKSSPLIKSSPLDKATPTSAKRGLKKFFTPSGINQNSETRENNNVKTKPPIGFRNLGNTCYLNSSLQILFSTKGFMDQLHRLFSQTWNLSKSHPQLPLTSALLSIAEAAGVLSPTTATTAVDPTQLKEAMDQATEKFQGYEQRDAHEFISDLIDTLHEELVEYNNNNHGKNDTAEEKKDTEHTSLPTDEHFYLNIKVCLTCDSCDYTRSKQEMYRHLSIDVGDDSEENWTAEKGLEQFFKPQKVDIRCEHCKSGVSATQTMKMTSCPNVLLLHLKRFIFSGSTFRKNKKRVVLPPKLQMGSFCSTSGNDSSFQLGGVVHHIGSSSSSGHYTTDAERSDQWVTFDDHNTKFTSISQVLNNEQKQQNSYLILYQKQQ